jgi:hypothetical protein
MKKGNVTFNKEVIIAGIDEARELYLLYAKSTPKETRVEWTDSKEQAFNFDSVEKASAALKHMDLPIPCAIIIRHVVVQVA